MAENNMQPPQNMANGNENFPNSPPLTITTDDEAVLEQNLPEQGADKPLAAAEGPETPNLSSSGTKKQIQRAQERSFNMKS